MVDPIELQIFNNLFSAVAQEMGAVLQRTAFSPNIKERRDFSCAIFDRRGRLVAQAAHIPVHLGSMPLSVKEVIKSLELKEGEMAVLNDPYRGGTHLPDITLVAPVYYQGELLFFVANRAHHSDVGGISAGSMPLSTSIFQEGLLIPPVKAVVGGEINGDFISLLKANSRSPAEREGDFKAQVMANRVGIKRLRELLKKYSPVKLEAVAEALLDYSERMMRSFIAEIPDGVYTFGDFMEDDGVGGRDFRVRVVLTVEGDRVKVDFSGSYPQSGGSINSVRAIVLSATLYAFKCLAGDEVPPNEGILRPIEVITRKGTVVDADFPAAVSAGNVETSQRLVDVLFGALSKALPKKIPAASQGTMNNLSFGGKGFTYYETIAGGSGAHPEEDGESAVHTHMTNTLNTPIEALELSYPVEITAYKVRENSGGEGLRRGGDGIVREFLFKEEVELTVISERRVHRPYGLQGGAPGKPGRNLLIKENGEVVELPAKFTLKVKPGQKIRIETPGGGGWGRKVK
ncbi:hydantoinase B/oxoprolinase family protein [Thermovibrio sp.]